VISTTISRQSPRLFKPRIRPSEVKKAVQLLLRLNLWKKHDGVYRANKRRNYQ